MKKKILISYLAFIHILLLLILYKSNFLSYLDARLGIGLRSEITQHYKTEIIFHELIDGSAIDGSTLFIGDSITEGLNTSAVIDKSINYGIGSDTTHGVIERLKLYENSIGKSKNIIIAIGINDLKFRDNDEIISNYKKILSSIPSDKTVLISSITPVDEKINPFKIDNTNERITEINKKLKNIAEESPNIEFVDIYGDLTDENGDLKESLNIGDGIHLNSNGYDIWIKKLKYFLSPTLN